MMVDPSGLLATEFVVGMLASGGLNAGPKLRIRIERSTTADTRFLGPVQRL